MQCSSIASSVTTVLWLTGKERSRDRVRSWSAVMLAVAASANSFLVNSVFASLFLLAAHPPLTLPRFSRCTFVVVVSHLSRFPYTFLTRPHTWLIRSERVGSKVTELSALINVIRIYVYTSTHRCLFVYHDGGFFPLTSIETIKVFIPKPKTGLWEGFTQKHFYTFSQT